MKKSTKPPRRYKTAVTFEYDNQAPECHRAEIAAANSRQGARRALEGAQKALPGRRPRSLLILMEEIGIVLAVLLSSNSVSADPILTLPTESAIVWTGTAGVVSRDAVTGPIRWTSSEHLRNACFAQWAEPGDSRPTDDQARPATCLTEDFLDGLFVYTLDLSQIDPCEKAQPDAELTAGGDVGVWIVVMASRMCGDRIYVGPDDHRPPPGQPTPVPESGTVVLVLVIVVVWAMAGWVRWR